MEPRPQSPPSPSTRCGAGGSFRSLRARCGSPWRECSWATRCAATRTDHCGRDGAERHHGEGERDGVPASEQQSETRRGGGEGLKGRDGQRFRLLLEEERFGGVKRRRNQLSDGLGMQGAERYDVKVDVQKERVLDHETTGLVEGEEEPLCVRLIARKLTHVQDEISDSSCERRTTSALSQKQCPGCPHPCCRWSLAEIQHHKLLDDTTTSALGIHGGSTRGSR